MHHCNHIIHPSICSRNGIILNMTIPQQFCMQQIMVNSHVINSHAYTTYYSMHCKQIPMPRVILCTYVILIILYSFEIYYFCNLIQVKFRRKYNLGNLHWLTSKNKLMGLEIFFQTDWLRRGLWSPNALLLSIILILVPKLVLQCLTTYLIKKSWLNKSDHYLVKVK